ncbi:hypothetical protein NHX12_013823 [Muraenolepis orangiensis]|uniref:Uncharacterized protein n=1 Tax=Muraenolepis orangiensis TaxID=630683 RepID=A0A9Q0I684_9TELE|nr:hypothetical protein NHX12_013823 [Muraenolepis orangiensis]
MTKKSAALGSAPRRSPDLPPSPPGETAFRGRWRARPNQPPATRSTATQPSAVNLRNGSYEFVPGRCQEEGLFPAHIPTVSHMSQNKWN